MQYFNVLTVLLLLFFTGLYLFRFRTPDSRIYEPAKAWTRAAIFFCCCSILSWLTGVQALIVKTPIEQQLPWQNTVWLWSTVGLAVLIFIGYWLVWARYTLRFERRLHLLAHIPFGLLWGASVGQLMLVIWYLTVSISGLTNPVWIVLVVWVVYGVIFGPWMLFVWDLYMVPEHDSWFSIILKTVAVHMPNSLLIATYLTLYESYIAMILLETLALTGAAIFMRIPPFWSREQTPAPYRHTLYGIPYAGGYVSGNPAEDRFLKAAHLPY